MNDQRMGVPSSGASARVDTLPVAKGEQMLAAPFDAIFNSPDAAELGDIDRTRAIALLIGPAVLGRLSTLPDFDYRDCAQTAVDGFLHVQRAQNEALNRAGNETAGA